MANIYDQFDTPTGVNIYDRFDKPAVKADPQLGNPQPLTFAERYIAPVLDKLGVGDIAGGNVRGSAVGRVAQGLADPGVSLVQMGANAIGQGGGVNKAIQDEEQKYQAARAEAGSTGFDPLRAGGNAGMDTFISAALPGIRALDKVPLTKTAIQGAGYSLLNPVTDGGDKFWTEKAKDAAEGAVISPLVAKAGGLLSRIISPQASVNPKLQLLRDEGVQPTLGQSLGGWANGLEERAQSLPIVGPMITRARQGAGEQLESAAFNRAAEPIGATVSAGGNAGVTELSDKIGQAYDQAIPKLSTNVLDPNFVGKLSSLRQMVQALPQQEAQQFDNIIGREIDGRISPNGTLSGQNLKDAWNALRDTAKTFSKSDDAYQSQLGQALKQTFQELKDQVVATNPAQNVQALQNADLAYANFKRIQRAASSVAADDGSFTPAQLHNAVRAMDTSKDKARFASGDALMQDLSSAGKSILSNKIPDSGTAARVQLGMLGAGLSGSALGAPVSLPMMAGLGAGAAAYTRPVQNALAAMVAKRPNQAPAIANRLREIMLSGAPISAALLEQLH